MWWAQRPTDTGRARIELASKHASRKGSHASRVALMTRAVQLEHARYRRRTGLRVADVVEPKVPGPQVRGHSLETTHRHAAYGEASSDYRTFVSNSYDREVPS